MTRVHVFCEGRTEESFVREVLMLHFQSMNIWLNPILVPTGQQGKGGVSSYGKIRFQIDSKCKEDRAAWVTTLIDFYGLPSNFPAMDSGGDAMDRAKAVENAFKTDVNQPNFIPNIVVHEFEGLLFSDPDAFAKWFGGSDVADRLNGIRNDFDTPEHINDGQTTAPSKRILTICGTYKKVLHGPLIALDIGLDTIRRECRKFDGWMKQLEELI